MNSPAPQSEPVRKKVLVCPNQVALMEHWGSLPPARRELARTAYLAFVGVMALRFGHVKS